jgi:hypothetical protein
MQMSQRRVHEPRPTSTTHVQSRGGLRFAHFLFGLAALGILSGFDGRGQQGPPPRTPKPILLPEANRPPDKNDLMVMKQQNLKNQSFEAANAERKRQMDDESTKLLLLAKDLKEQTDKLGDSPLTPRAVREAEVIEILARDLKDKMKLTVGGN